MANESDTGEETKPKGKAKKKSNIENLPDLAKEFKTGKMPTPKLSALRKKLVQLFTDEKISSDEQELMETILRKERTLRRITSGDNYLLNALESERCESLAVVTTSDAPAVLHLKKDLECKFSFDEEYDDLRGREDSVGRYHVYVPRTIPTRHQLKNSTVERELKGHPVAESEYPEDRVVIHRLILKVREFQQWFEVRDEDILNKSETAQEAQYQF